MGHREPNLTGDRAAPPQQAEVWGGSHCAATEQSQPCCPTLTWGRLFLWALPVLTGTGTPEGGGYKAIRLLPSRVTPSAQPCCSSGAAGRLKGRDCKPPTTGGCWGCAADPRSAAQGPQPIPWWQVPGPGTLTGFSQLHTEQCLYQRRLFLPHVSVVHGRWSLLGSHGTVCIGSELVEGSSGLK